MKKLHFLLLLLMMSIPAAFGQAGDLNSYKYCEKIADSLLSKGQKDSAIFYYKKALSVFPNSWKSYSAVRNPGREVPGDTLAVLLQKLILSDVDYLPNIVFGKGGTRDLRLSILWPKEPSRKKLPVMVYIHGGGWYQNTKETGLISLLPFVKQGYICVPVEYRLSTKAVFPAQVRDVKCAIRFLRAHAELYGIDPERIAVFGESAGGHLASLAGTSGGIKELEGNGGWPDYSSRVQAVCDWSGPSYFPPDTLTGNANFRLLGGTTTQKAHLAKIASPLNYISADNPPFLIFHGTADAVAKIEQSDTLYQSLRKANVEATLKRFEGGGHFVVYGAQVGEISGSMPQFRAEMLQLMIDFFLINT